MFYGPSLPVAPVTEVREQDFELVVALGRDGEADGRLYLDDGESLEQDGTSDMRLEFWNESLRATGAFNYDTSTIFKAVTVLRLEAGGGGNRTRTKVEIDDPLQRTGEFELDIHEGK